MPRGSRSATKRTPARPAGRWGQGRAQGSALPPVAKGASTLLLDHLAEEIAAEVSIPVPDAGPRGPSGGVSPEGRGGHSCGRARARRQRPGDQPSKRRGGRGEVGARVPSTRRGIRVYRRVLGSGDLGDSV